MTDHPIPFEWYDYDVLDRPVDYFYEMTGEVERIEAPKKPLVRRHHRSRGG